MKGREIKFRGLDHKGVWQYGHYAYYVAYPDSYKKHWIEPLGIQVQEETVGQFTGLKDSVGNEIYEGDIIRILSTGEEREVFYHKCAFGVQINEALFAPIYWHEDILIIGNRYEHPELLPKTN